MLKLDKLGHPTSEKALAVNLDPSFYGSFAEIGAGQEVSRAFLTAGAAAGTVARSLSAYDMLMSDVTYGRCKRYVTQERLSQMLNTEYQTVELCLRGTKGVETRFFSFASTLAAKAYMSNRECEGWIGVKFQSTPMGQPNTVMLHVRMCDATAQLQGEAIGVLGTNLVYLCNFCSDPYLITSFLLDGLDPGRLEVDCVDFSGPSFPEGSVDPRLLAMRMVQFRVATSVFLEYDTTSGSYVQNVPNSALYKKPLVVQRSRYKPVTYTHIEMIEAASRKLGEELEQNASPMKILNLQIDDITKPQKLMGTEKRLGQARKLVMADSNQDGYLSKAELTAVLEGKLDGEELDALLEDLIKADDLVSIDTLAGLSKDSNLVMEFVDRFRMLMPLKLPVLLSGIRQTHKLSEYLARYTREQIVLTIGGGSYDIDRGLFNETLYAEEEGGMLQAFGQLFSGKVRIFQYPNITPDGTVVPTVFSKDINKDLHKYLTGIGKLEVISNEFMGPEAVEKDKNEYLRGQSEDVMQLIKEGSSDWEKYVPPEVVESMKKRWWKSNQSPAKSADIILGQL